MTTDEVKLEQWQDEQIDYYNREDANEETLEDKSKTDLHKEIQEVDNSTSE